MDPPTIWLLAACGAFSNRIFSPIRQQSFFSLSHSLEVSQPSSSFHTCEKKVSSVSCCWLERVASPLTHCACKKTSLFSPSLLSCFIFPFPSIRCRRRRRWSAPAAPAARCVLDFLIVQRPLEASPSSTSCANTLQSTLGIFLLWSDILSGAWLLDCLIACTIYLFGTVPFIRSIDSLIGFFWVIILRLTAWESGLYPSAQMIKSQQWVSCWAGKKLPPPGNADITGGDYVPGTVDESAGAASRRRIGAAEFAAKWVFLSVFLRLLFFFVLLLLGFCRGDWPLAIAPLVWLLFRGSMGGENGRHCVEWIKSQHTKWPTCLYLSLR